MNTNRRVSLDELQARSRAGDYSFLRWLRSFERREFLARQKNRASNLFLPAYLHVATKDLVGPILFLNIGCGVGTQAHAVARLQRSEIKFIGMDYDPEALRICRTRFGRLSQFYFQTIDYLNLPSFPQKFDFVIISPVLQSLPTYRGIIAHLWPRCTRGFLVMLDGQLPSRSDDYLTIDIAEQRLRANFSKENFEDFLLSESSHVDRVTVYDDVDQTADHLYLLRRDTTVPSFVGVHTFAPSGVTFPFYEWVTIPESVGSPPPIRPLTSQSGYCQLSTEAYSRLGSHG